MCPANPQPQQPTSFVRGTQVYAVSHLDDDGKPVVVNVETGELVEQPDDR